MLKTLDELERAYARRKELWTALEADLERCGDYSLMLWDCVAGLSTLTPSLCSKAARASAELEALSTDVERTIAVLEKKSKTLDKDSASAANQKMLRNLVAQFSA